MVVYPKFGENIALNKLNSLNNYVVATQEIPWDEWSKKLQNPPKHVVYCKNMEFHDLKKVGEKNAGDYEIVIGFGGGVACDTGKFLALRWGLPLITIPSIISVDAFLCNAVGIRENNRVHYIDAPAAQEILIDYELIRTAPNYLNYAGVGDALSCASALGDWLIGHKQFGDKFDQSIFDRTKSLVRGMLENANQIHQLSNKGLKMLVENFLLGEVILSEEWGNARPEEGSEHFLAYALEKINPRPYPHGALICLNVLIILKLQGKSAIFKLAEIKDYLDKVGVIYSPKKMDIPKDIFKKALGYVQAYTKSEKLEHGLWYLEDPFEEMSIEEIIDWIYSF